MSGDDRPAPPPSPGSGDQPPSPGPGDLPPSPGPGDLPPSPGPGDLPARLRAMTAARVGLGRAGAGLTTRDALAFSLDHARAREAVWSQIDLAAIKAALTGHPRAVVASAAADRAAYIRRPDLGRRLAPGTVLDVPEAELVLVLADGLSARAVNENAAAVVRALRRLRGQADPVVLVERGRVAIGDEIGAALKAEAVVVLIGERPGLSAADSLGAYVTWAPQPGLPDSRRNCISNIRHGGIAPADAAARLHALLGRMRIAGTSGVGLPVAGDTLIGGPLP